MRYTLLLSITQFLVFPLSAQIDSIHREKIIQIEAGFMKHGTGDLRGFNVSMTFRQSFRPKIGLAVSLGSTFHDGHYPLIYEDQSGNSIDGSFRFGQQGLQLVPRLEISFIHNTSIELGVGVGPMLRYQSSSLPDALATYFPAATGLPFPVSQIINDSPQRSLAFGGMCQFYLYKSISRFVIAGVTAGLQTDTNSDTITQFGLTTGIRL